MSFEFVEIIALLSILHLILPFSYYVYVRRASKRKPWNVNLDKNYSPRVTMIVPTFNESAIISKQLENLTRLDYPAERLEVIAVDSASTDDTVKVINDYISQNEFPFRILILEQEKRSGKAKALNFALQYATGEIIATVDADAFWESSVLRNLLPFMADPSIGAATGEEHISNANKNIYTIAEDYYRKFYNTVRLGESKLGSTFVFQGELALYKRKALEKFEDAAGSDDTGTVINIASKGYRCIFVPIASFRNDVPYTLKGRIEVKTRRAQHLMLGFWRAMKLRTHQQLKGLTLTIFMNFYLYGINPFVGVLLFGTILYLFFLFPFLLALFLLLLVKRIRILFISYITSNIALLLATVRCLMGDRQIVWKKIEK